MNENEIKKLKEENEEMRALIEAGTIIQRVTRGGEGEKSIKRG